MKRNARLVELRAKSNEELQELEVKLRYQLFVTRIGHYVGEGSFTARSTLQGLKRDIARIKTIMTQRAKATTTES